MQYICQICGYIYDEEKEGKKFEELEEGFSCPSCKVGKKSDFKAVEPMAEETKEDRDSSRDPDEQSEEVGGGNDKDED
ncbi:MAG: rubredoxin [Candidatus Parcubacteria bacterium]|nr:rubredoxin [Candidatus Parcubacteria bacterium]